MTATGNLISAKVSVVMSVPGEMGVAFSTAVGIGLASCARLVGVLIMLMSKVSMMSALKPYRSMAVILLAGDLPIGLLL
jgi:hypothetical protein